MPADVLAEHVLVQVASHVHCDVFTDEAEEDSSEGDRNSCYKAEQGEPLDPFGHDVSCSVDLVHWQPEHAEDALDKQCAKDWVLASNDNAHEHS